VVKPARRQPSNRRKSTQDASKGYRTPKTSMMTRHSTPGSDRVPGSLSEPGQRWKITGVPIERAQVTSQSHREAGGPEAEGAAVETTTQKIDQRPPEARALWKAAREVCGAKEVFDFKPRVEQGRPLTSHELGAILAQLAYPLNDRRNAVRAVGDQDLRPTCPGDLLSDRTARNQGVREPEGDLQEVQAALSTREEEQENVGSSEYQYWDRGRFEERVPLRRSRH
jgi:hypothetical protein